MVARLPIPMDSLVYGSLMERIRISKRYGPPWFETVVHVKTDEHATSEKTKLLWSLALPKRNKVPKWNDKKSRLAYKRLYERFWKAAAIQHLGGKCIGCGIGDERLLCLNHKDGGGTSERGKVRPRKGYILYRDVAQGLRDDDVDLRCFNCNWLYEYERGRIR